MVDLVELSVLSFRELPAVIRLAQEAPGGKLDDSELLLAVARLRQAAELKSLDEAISLSNRSLGLKGAF
jgi:hypothetical protein